MIPEERSEEETHILIVVEDGCIPRKNLYVGDVRACDVRVKGP